MEQIAKQIKAYNDAVNKSCIHDTAAVFVSYYILYNENIGIGTVKHWWITGGSPQFSPSNLITNWYYCAIHKIFVGAKI